MDSISMFVGAAIGIVLLWVIFMLITTLKKPEDLSWLKEVWQKQLDQNEEKNHILKNIAEELNKF